jgi:predicted permease
VVATPALGVLIPGTLPIGATPEIDWRVFAFAAALTLGTSVAFGAGPAWGSSRRVDLDSLRSRFAGGSRTERLRGALVLAEVAATVTLLVGTGLLLKAMWRVQGVHPGFEPRGVLTMRTAVPMTATADQRRDFYARVLGEVRGLPGVISAAYISFLPMTFGGGNFTVTAPGVTLAEETRAHTRFVTPDYFKTLGIPLLAGRDVSQRDGGDVQPVVVVSQSLARRFWPGQDPIGRTISHGTVIGVAGDVAMRGLEQASLPQVYLSWEQIPPGLVFYAPKDLAIRTMGDPLALAPQVRRIIRAASPEQAVSDIRQLETIVDSQTATRRAQLHVLGTFAGIAFLLAAVGIHGLLSFAVSSRTREVGVRMALGAGRGNILSMFLRQAVLLSAIGVALAIPLAYAAARAMTALLFGVEPGDPFIYASAALLALAMTLVGSLRPAVRAACVDPAVTIRAE